MLVAQRFHDTRGLPGTHSRHGGILLAEGLDLAPDPHERGGQDVDGEWFNLGRMVDSLDHQTARPRRGRTNGDRSRAGIPME